jgi:hypothetical protein
MASRCLLLVLLLVVSAIVPGLCVVRKLTWKPAEKLVASIGFSFCILYLLAFLIFVMRWSNDGHVVVSAALLLLMIMCRRDLLHLARNRRVRSLCLAFAFLFGWGLLLLAVVRNYSGGVCGYDWFEQWVRTKYFVEPSSRYMTTSGVALTARPPFMNLVTGHFLAQVAVRSTLRFEFFQITYLFLNLLIFFPLCLMLPIFFRDGMRHVFLLVVLLMANPLLWWNVTFTWTKVFAGFYVILALYFYVTSLRSQQELRMVAAFFFLAAGFLVHFSAGPYGLALALHYLFRVFPRSANKKRALAMTAIAPAALLATWFGYSSKNFGIHGALASNTTATALETLNPSENIQKIIENLYTTAVPHPLRLSRGEFDKVLDQPNRWGYVRDYAMSIYGPNFLFSMGSIGGFLVVWLLTRKSNSCHRAGVTAAIPPSGFWAWFVLCSAVLGVMAHPTAEQFGVWQICGQPLTFLALAFLAARYTTLPIWAQLLGIAGCIFDFALGVLLHFHLESQVFATIEPAAPIERLMTGNEPQVLPSDELLSKWAIINWKGKLMYHVPFVGDVCTAFANSFQVVAAALFGLVVAALIFRVIVRRRRNLLRAQATPFYQKSGSV